MDATAKTTHPTAVDPSQETFYDWLEQGLETPVTTAQAKRLEDGAKQYGPDLREAILQGIDVDARPLLMYSLLTRDIQSVPADLRPGANLAAALRSIREAAKQDEDISFELRTFYFRFTDSEYRGFDLGFTREPSLPLSIRPISGERPSFLIRGVHRYEPPEAENRGRVFERIGSTWKVHIFPGEPPFDLSEMSQPSLRALKHALQSMFAEPNAPDLLHAVGTALGERIKVDQALWDGIKDGVLRSLAPESEAGPTVGRTPKGLIREVLGALGLIEKK